MSTYLGCMPVNDPEAYFISYNTEDGDRIRDVVCKLQELGVPFWYDYGLEYGEKWNTQIAEHIDTCKAVILFFSKGILQKENSYVRKEYKMAKEFYEKKVYVVLLDQISKKDIPYHMIDWWIDILSDQTIAAYNVPLDEAFCRSLAKAIGCPVGEAPAAQPAPAPEPAPEPVPEAAPAPEPPSRPIVIKTTYKKPYIPSLHGSDPAPQPEAAPVPEPQPQPAAATTPSTIENWKQVMQRQQAAAVRQEARPHAVENWKQVQQQIPQPQPGSASASATGEPSWRKVLKKAADAFKQEYLGLSADSQQEEPQQSAPPVRETWRLVQQQSEKEDK